MPARGNSVVSPEGKNATGPARAPAEAPAEATLDVAEGIRIPLREMTFAFARSSGPGGQHVNKVSSKAVLRWAVLESVHLPDDVRARFRDRYGSRLTLTGEIVIASQRFRSQRRNIEDCLAKLAAMLAGAAAAPVPRRPTRPGRTARQRRLTGKRARGVTKRLRKRPGDEE